MAPWMKEMIKDHIDRKFLEFIYLGSALIWKKKEIVMPIPGDNGQPELERKKQEERISKVANEGACVQKEVIMNPKAPKEKSIFGEV